MEHPELLATPQWRSTGDAFFPVAADVEGSRWVLRVNSFPDHPLWTLFVDGQRRLDIDDAPLSWSNPAGKAPLLEPDEIERVLAPVRGFVAYGSEVGKPCGNPFCCG